MHRIVPALLLALLTPLPPAIAGEAGKPLGVVELFTSQGCSSCPPADAALEALAARGDVVALGYHVDYWDYLGWKDSLGSKDNTHRQYGYMATLGRNNVYTPQAVINGVDHLNGGDLGGILSRLEGFAGSGGGMAVPVTLSGSKDRIHVVIPERPGLPDANVVLVWLIGSEIVEIGRGENAGRSITYVNAVVDYSVIGIWEGEQMTLDVPPAPMTGKKTTGCAVLLQVMQDGKPGRIIGAAIVSTPAG